MQVYQKSVLCILSLLRAKLKNMFLTTKSDLESQNREN